MRLIRCHIESFGKFSSRDFDFSPSLNCFCFDNGDGKTTLAAFIKAMFYGLPTTRSNGGKMDDRKHYFPFESAGACGGSVDFEYNGAEYRIQRSFHAQSGTGDSCEVFRGGVATDELGSVPGLTLFGVDPESFERTVFWGAGDLYTGSIDGTTAGMSTALGRTDGAGTEARQFKAAIDRAEDEIKRLQSRGRKIPTQEIPQLEKKISVLREEIAGLDALDQKVAGLYEKRKELLDKLDGAEKELALSRKAARSAEEKSVYDGLSASAASASGKVDEINRKYRRGLPPEKTAELIEEILSQLAAARGALAADGPSWSGKDELAALESKYPEGVPSEEETRLLSELERAAAAVPDRIALDESPFAKGGADEALARANEETAARDRAAEKLKEQSLLPKKKMPKGA